MMNPLMVVTSMIATSGNIDLFYILVLTFSHLLNKDVCLDTMFKE